MKKTHTDVQSSDMDSMDDFPILKKGNTERLLLHFFPGKEKFQSEKVRVELVSHPVKIQAADSSEVSDDQCCN